MSLNASRIVSITPRVLSAGSSTLETNGMILTKNEKITEATPLLEFSSADGVSQYFGYESPEADFARQYFTGVNNQTKAINTLFVGKAWYGGEPTSARLVGGVVDDWDSVKETLKTLDTNEEYFTVGIDKRTVQVSIDWSGVEEELTPEKVVEEFNKVLDAKGGVMSYADGRFTITSKTSGADSKITLAAHGPARKNVADYLELSDTTGAVTIQGTNPITIAENMAKICGVSQNWVGFTTIYPVTDIDEAEAFSDFADANDDYVYFWWGTDKNMLDVTKKEETIPYKLAEKNYNCTACVYGTQQDAALYLAIGASINWDANQGVKTWFAKNTSGIAANVTAEADADALEALNVNYMGAFATRNADFDLINRGQLVSGIYLWIDTLYVNIWFKARLQVAIMDGMAMAGRVPYNSVGYAMVGAWMQDPITQAKRNGCIDTGMTLSSTQESTLIQESGNPDIRMDLFTNGIWYKIGDPLNLATRTERGSPWIYTVFSYSGSIQRISLPLSQIV